jgi:hypothetical protein
VRDRGLIVGGLVAFVALVTLPVWYQAAFGTPRTQPTLARPTGERCVLPRAEMRHSHMDVLVAWRERVVRGGERQLVAAGGRAMPISLTGTCLGCHGAKRDFCDRCHEYASVQITCFDCHVDREKPGAPARATALAAADGRAGAER